MHTSDGTIYIAIITTLKEAGTKVQRRKANKVEYDRAVGATTIRRRVVPFLITNTNGRRLHTAGPGSNSLEEITVVRSSKAPLKWITKMEKTVLSDISKNPKIIPDPKDQDACKNAVKHCLLLAGRGLWLYGHVFPPVYLLNREANHPFGVRRNNARYRISDMATERLSDTYGTPSSGRASDDDESGTSTSSESPDSNMTFNEDSLSEICKK
ncbi:hypothetical protein IW261DRAFT_1414192 [Armillaria novae-zelandiae]|uniref:Uncharacterized protein n=1 Tax=Armillaria novae-zelandiae TaxID=153914 RepID=A0AA39PQJ7_9AGAR|nr:hypothetical protein IW261DRAFT_1414192 [Armillaria novae-zelandiae]